MVRPTDRPKKETPKLIRPEKMRHRAWTFGISVQYQLSPGHPMFFSPVRFRGWNKKRVKNGRCFVRLACYCAADREKRAERAVRVTNSTKYATNSRATDRPPVFAWNSLFRGKKIYSVPDNNNAVGRLYFLEFRKGSVFFSSPFVNCIFRRT